MSSTESPSQRPRSQKRRRIMWGAVGIFAVLAGLAIYAGVHQGVRTIDLKNGTISFRDVNPSEIQQAQNTLKADAAAADTRAQAQSSPAPSVPDISGYWNSSNGFTYYIKQYGDRAAMQEISAYGITAVAEGPVASDSARLEFRAVDGSVGQAYLSFQVDGSIFARFYNMTYGKTSDATLTHQ